MPDTTWYPAINPDGTPEQGVVGRFEYLDDLDVAASRAADEKRFRKIIVLRSKATSSSDDCVQPVKPHNQEGFARRFPKAWAVFQGEAVPVEGTPLTEIEASESQALTCRMYGISTVEQMAAASDAGCESMGFGFRTLRKAAQAYLERLKAERLERALKAGDEKAPEPAPKRRGRPPKAEQPAAA